MNKKVSKISDEEAENVTGGVGNPNDSISQAAKERERNNRANQTSSPESKGEANKGKDYTTSGDRLV